MVAHIAVISLVLHLSISNGKGEKWVRKLGKRNGEASNQGSCVVFEMRMGRVDPLGN
jgi:hypothetical protein